jgi:hypothetical protein
MYTDISAKQSSSVELALLAYTKELFMSEITTHALSTSAMVMPEQADKSQCAKNQHQSGEQTVYGAFVRNTSQEVQKDFYRKLAEVLLRGDKK